ncbi:asparagine synthase (glutamine-hydrolyzing) [Roseimaritima ulvae]|uniref:asparagine synthase (glutamine-hydrolyzing) n=1 Tax=Roseimaritima ulvae TaxID=980254 RepID=A0A5B9QMA4_9BACT|nr:asparagine synthase (glutamine-hydrolyzing) [Roseimaritima ulvae]QEG38972.1 Asparagine synthetase [glutamine-hydrolyzing] 1 [Roseimaritima ulvae]
MCGIAGILELAPTQSAPADVLERMLSSIIHRGPDEDGRLIDRELAMGMRRLSIIDLADGTQPMFDEAGRYGIVFNGEIYNYRELRQQLIARGHTLKTHSDTEVIVHLYEEFGSDCLEHLRGMFAFAVWDKQRRELFIARDRLGIKPLYYAQRGQTLLFGSEIKALLQHPQLTAELDRRGLSDYLSLKYVPAPRTMFSGVHSLPPGHYLLARDGNIETHQYWDLSFEKPSTFRSDEEYLEELEALVRESVRLRLRSDVPFGAFLSGGVDSSLIVALMADELDTPVNTFSVGFAGSEGQDELPYAQIVADRFGCQHHTFAISANDFLQHAEQVLWYLDQPIADQATVATHMVAQLARQHVKMVLTGEGGDELFAGYARYQGERYSPWTRHLPAAAGGIVRRAADILPGMRRGKIALNALTIRDEATRFANWFPMFSDDGKRQLLADWSAEHSRGAGHVFDRLLQQCDAGEPLDRMLYCDTKAWLVDYLLLRGDKLTMANSLEARVPLLDHKLVEFAARLPTRLKLHGRTRKYLLKRLGSQLLPDSIIHRKKQGFPIPIERWLRHEARDLVHDALSEQRLRDRGLFNPKYVRTLVQRHESNYADHATEIWGLVSLEMWLRRFVDAPTSSLAARPVSQLN